MGRKKGEHESEISIDGALAVQKEFSARTFRNQVGKYQAPYDPNKWITYGLGKGSPDRVGYLPIIVTPEMVGRRVAVFVGLEAKAKGKKATKEQRQFLKALKRAGAIAGVYHSADEACRVLRRFVKRTGGRLPRKYKRKPT